MSEYTEKADSFLAKFGLTFEAAGPLDTKPEWSSDDKAHKYWQRGPFMDRDNPTTVSLTVGDGWEITIRRGTHKLSFPFWSSISDKAKRLGLVSQLNARSWPSKWPFPEKDHKPTAYDVLACISGDVHTPASFEDFCAEYGYEVDSRKAEATHRRAAMFALQLRQFFTTAELDDLAEIQ